METPIASSGIAYAGFWRRFAGWLIDFLILTILSHWILALVSQFYKQPIPDTLTFSSFASAFSGLALILIITDFIIIALYYCLFEASHLQATPGKYIVGIKITDINGVRISYGKSFLRRVYSILSAVIIFIGFIMAAFTPKKQTLHDMLAKTVVVIDKKKTTLAIVGIIILTIILGILSDKFLGAGFHFGVTNSSVMSGAKVDAALQDTIIQAVLQKKAIFETNDAQKIREYLLTSNTEPQEIETINHMSDADLLKFVNLANEVTSQMNDQTLRSPEASWTFNGDKSLVRIRVKNNGPQSAKYGTVYLDMQLVNGKWY